MLDGRPGHPVSSDQVLLLREERHNGTADDRTGRATKCPGQRRPTPDIDAVWLARGRSNRTGLAGPVKGVSGIGAPERQLPCPGQPGDRKVARHPRGRRGQRWRRQPAQFRCLPGTTHPSCPAYCLSRSGRMVPQSTPETRKTHRRSCRCVWRMTAGPGGWPRSMLSMRTA